MLLMIIRGIEVEYVTLFIDKQKLITNTRKIIKKQRIFISSVLRCKQFIWMGNITKGCCK